MKLQIKIALILIFIVSAISISSSILARKILFEGIEKERITTTDFIARVVEKHFIYLKDNKDFTIIKEHIDLLRLSNKNIQYIYIVDSQNNILAGSSKDKIPHDLSHPEKDTRDIVNETKYRMKTSPSMYVYIGIDQKYYENNLHYFHEQIFILTILLTLLGVLFGILMSNRITAPLNILAEKMKGYGEGKSDKLIDIADADKEVADLINSFNMMIKERKQLEEKFTSIIKNSQAIIFMIDKDGIFQILEGKSLSVLGLRPGEAVGRSVYEMYKAFPQITDAVKLALKGELSTDLLEINGSFFDIFYSPYRDIDGNTIGVIGMAIDMTDKQKAIQSLKESEEQFRNTFDQAAIGICHVGLDGNFLKVNKQLCDIIGYSEEELLKMSFTDVTLPEDIDISFSRVERIKNREINSFSIEKRYVKKDGSIIWGAVSASGCVSQAGELKYLIATVKDITEKKKLEGLLTESEDRFRSTFEQAAIGICHTGLDGYFIRVNSRFCDIFGYTKDELLKLHFKDITHPDDLTTSMELVNKVKNREIDSFSMEKKYIRKDKSVIWGSLIVSGCIDQAGDLKYFITTVEEITDKKRLEEAVANLLSGGSSKFGKEFFETVVLQLSDILKADYTLIGVMSDKEETKMKTLAFCAKGEIKDNIEHELAGTPCERIFAKENFICEEGLIEQYPNVQLFKNMNIEGYVGVPLFDSQGESLGIVIAMFNEKVKDAHLSESILQIFASRISSEIERMNIEDEQHILEKQVQHSQKLESLGVLAGGIAHHFNNLLMGILGNTDLALMKLSETSAVIDNIKEIEKISLKASDLTRQILAYSGKGSFIVEPLDLSDLIEEMKNFIEISVSNKIILNYHLDENMPNIEVDVSQIRQVIMNLITNASESIENKSGEISIATGVKYCDALFFKNSLIAPLKADQERGLAEGEYVYLEISDTGCGMDKETVQKMFEPFFSTKFTGRGLGMPAVLGIVSGHKGAIHIESSPGKGSIFLIVFPVSEKKNKFAKKNLQEINISAKNKTILLVDDDAAIRTLGKAMLQELGFNVMVAENGRHALEVFNKNIKVIDCVLLDLTMPYMDGEECFIELRKVKKDVPVILTSGYSANEVIERFRDKGISGFIQKPYKLKQLQIKMLEVLGMLED